MLKNILKTKLSLKIGIRKKLKQLPLLKKMKMEGGGDIFAPKAKPEMHQFIFNLLLQIWTKKHKLPFFQFTDKVIFWGATSLKNFLQVWK